MASRIIITFHHKRPPIRQIRLCPYMTITKIFQIYYPQTPQLNYAPQLIRTSSRAQLLTTSQKLDSLFNTGFRLSHQRSTTATKKYESNRKLSQAPPLKTEEEEPLPTNTQPIFHIEYQDNTHYYGQIIGTKREGMGALYDDNQNVIYLGEWKDDKFNGIGVLYHNSSIYKGEFKDGLPEGQGIQTENENKFYGYFKKGLRDGVGTLYSQGNMQQQGFWKEDKYLNTI